MLIIHISTTHRLIVSLIVKPENKKKRRKKENTRFNFKITDFSYRSEMRLPVVPVILILLSCILKFSICAKILGVFAMPAKSHSIMINAILEGLIARGHEVIYWRYDINFVPPNGF